MNGNAKTGETSSVSPIVILTDHYELKVTSLNGFYFSGATDAHTRALAEACFRALNDRFGPGNVRLITVTLSGGDDPAWDIPKPLDRLIFIEDIYPIIGEIPWDYRFLIEQPPVPEPTPELPAIYIFRYSPPQGKEYTGTHWDALADQFRLLKERLGFEKIFIDGSLPVDKPPIEKILHVKDQLIGNRFSVDLSHVCGYREPMSYDLSLCPDELGGLQTSIFNSIDELQDRVTDLLEQES